MGKMKESPRYNVIAVRVTDEEMKALKYLSEMRQTTYSQLIREALATAGFPSGVVAEGDAMVPLCSG